MASGNFYDGALESPGIPRGILMLFLHNGVKFW